MSSVHAVLEADRTWLIRILVVALTRSTGKSVETDVTIFCIVQLSILQEPPHSLFANKGSTGIRALVHHLATNISRHGKAALVRNALKHHVSISKSTTLVGMWISPQLYEGI